MDNTINVISGTLLLVKNIKTAVKITKRYVKYTPTGSTITYKGDNGEDVTEDIPSLEQISKLAKKLLIETSQYQNANFLSFATQVAFYFPEANLYEIFLLSVVNIAGGIQEAFCITEEKLDSMITSASQQIQMIYI